MNSWATMLLLDMAKGKYLNLSPRDKTQEDWLILWQLVQMGEVRVSDGPV